MSEKTIIDRVVVAGLGSSGVKIVNRLSGIKEAAWLDIVAIDSDADSLAKCNAGKKLSVDPDWRNGLGCGGDVVKGQRSLARERSKIRELIEGASLLIVTGGLGGGTCTGGAPIVASEANACGIPAVFLLSMPFVFEGHSKTRTAEDGIKELLPITDALLSLPNDLLFSSLDAASPVEEAFSKADEEMARAIIGVCEIIRCDNLLSTDFSDFKSIFSNSKSVCSIGVGLADEQDGLNRCHIAMERMLESPFLGGIKQINSADAVFITITGGKDLKIGEMKKSLEAIANLTDSNARLIIGANTDPAYENAVQLTVITAQVEGLAQNVDKEQQQVISPVISGPSLKKQADAFAEYEQQELPLVQISRGIFLHATPTMHDGFDLDIPTFQRENIIIDKGD